jgi:hypothetical protein
MNKMILLIMSLLSLAALCSCVSAGYIDFATAESLEPLHPSIGVGLENDNVTACGDIFGSARLGLLPGMEIGLRAGLGTVLGDVKYEIPFGWDPLSISIGFGGGANFDHEIAQIQAPIHLTYPFADWIALTASQTTTLYVGGHSGWAVSGGLGLKISIGPFFIFPNVVGGYFAPAGGQWSTPGGGIVSNVIIASEQPLFAGGVALGFDF